MSNVLDPKTVARMAFLARLSKDPSPEFLEKYGRELGAILGYVAELSEVDTSKVTNLLGSARIVTLDELADDELNVSPSDYQRIRQNIIDNFPTRQGDLLVVPGIFEN